MASAEGGLVPNGVEYGKGCPLSSRLRGLGERRELGRTPAENGFWRILKSTESSLLYLYDKIWGGGAICINVPSLQILEGGLVPPAPPGSTPMAVEVGFKNLFFISLQKISSKV